MRNKPILYGLVAVLAIAVAVVYGWEFLAALKPRPSAAALARLAVEAKTPIERQKAAVTLADAGSEALDHLRRLSHESRDPMVRATCAKPWPITATTRAWTCSSSCSRMTRRAMKGSWCGCGRPRPSRNSCGKTCTSLPAGRPRTPASRDPHPQAVAGHVQPGHGREDEETRQFSRPLGGGPLRPAPPLRRCPRQNQEDRHKTARIPPSKKLWLSAESGDDCGAAVPAAQKVGAQDGRRNALAPQTWRRAEVV